MSPCACRFFFHFTFIISLQSQPLLSGPANVHRHCLMDADETLPSPPEAFACSHAGQIANHQVIHNSTVHLYFLACILSFIVTTRFSSLSLFPRDNRVNSNLLSIENACLPFTLSSMRVYIKRTCNRHFVSLCSHFLSQSLFFSFLPSFCVNIYSRATFLPALP